MLRTGIQFLKFAVGGAVGTLCHYATLVSLVEMWGSPVVLATFTGFTVGAVVNYLLARRIVFLTSRPHRVAAPRFAAVAITGAVVNTVIVAWLFSAGAHYIVAQLLATGVVLILNFSANKHWTFRD